MVSHRVRRENINLVLALVYTSLLCTLRGLCVTFFQDMPTQKLAFQRRSQAYRAVLQTGGVYAVTITRTKNRAVDSGLVSWRHLIN